MKPYRALIRSRWHRVSLTLMVVFYPTIACLPMTSAERTLSTPWAVMDPYVEVQMAEQRIPGLAFGIVHGDQIVHLTGFGVADPRGNPVTAQTTFSIGSFTKSFTAVAIMQLVEAGQLELDTPVQHYLPWFGVADSDASGRITLRHLLHHTSGLPRDVETLAAGGIDQGSDARKQRLQALRTVRLQQPIGTYAYSNVGYQVLAMVIQQATGQSYEDYVQQHIFAPSTCVSRIPQLMRQRNILRPLATTTGLACYGPPRSHRTAPVLATVACCHPPRTLATI